MSKNSVAQFSDELERVQLQLSAAKAALEQLEAAQRDAEKAALRAEFAAELKGAQEAARVIGKAHAEYHAACADLEERIDRAWSLERKLNGSAGFSPVQHLVKSSFMVGLFETIKRPARSLDMWIRSWGEKERALGLHDTVLGAALLAVGIRDTPPYPFIRAVGGEGAVLDLLASGQYQDALQNWLAAERQPRRVSSQSEPTPDNAA